MSFLLKQVENEHRENHFGTNTHTQDQEDVFTKIFEDLVRPEHRVHETPLVRNPMVLREWKKDVGAGKLKIKLRVSDDSCVRENKNEGEN